MSKSPIHLDADVAIKALEDHKTKMFGLVNDPKFREFWNMMGGTSEQLDSAKVELEKRKSR